MTEFRRRYSDQAPKLARQHISRLAFLLAALLIAVTSVSLMFVGFVATRASTQQAIENEKRLFQSVLSDQLRAIVREQIRVTSSDTSVEKLVRSFSPDYVQSSFDRLWTVYGHSKIMLISGGGKVLAESFEDYTHIIERPLGEVPELQTIADKLNAKYAMNRVRVPGGYGHLSLQGSDPETYAMMGFVQIDGKPALYGAMPVIPDKFEKTLPDGPPTILLSARYIDDELLKTINSQLDFAGFSFSESVTLSADVPSLPVANESGVPVGAFQWDSDSASTSLWPTIIPVIALLSVALAAMAFGIAWRIGQLTSSLQASERQNRFLALHDTLSGLGNRLLFNRVMDTSVKELPDKSFAVLHCDLDKFKLVNDTYGHAAGDTVIKTVATRLQEVIGNHGLVCRIGGDEFMVIYRKATSRNHLSSLCGDLISSVHNPIALSDGNTAQVGLSIGVALAPDDGTDPEQIICLADAALYHSKALGRSRYTFHSDVPAGNGSTPAGTLSGHDAQEDAQRERSA